LIRLVDSGELEWQQFLRLKDALLFQYEALPAPWREVVLGVVSKAEQSVSSRPAD
jgi:hypothetical protein